MVSNRRSVLIADDNKDLCELMKELVKSSHMFSNIIVAFDGVSAVNKIDNQDFELFLIDLLLPKLSGIEIIEKLIHEKKGNSKNIIVISGSINPVLFQKLRFYKINKILVKPFDPKKFLDLIKSS